MLSRLFLQDITPRQIRNLSNLPTSIDMIELQLSSTELIFPRNFLSSISSAHDALTPNAISTHFPKLAIFQK